LEPTLPNGVNLDLALNQDQTPNETQEGTKITLFNTRIEIP
jgi:hypothetical protein